MFTQTAQYGENGVLLLPIVASCPILLPKNWPTAIVSAQTVRTILNMERVAMLSFSGSARQMVDKVITATRLAKEKILLAIDGELQVDAAWFGGSRRKAREVLLPGKPTF